jgi:hypothetical protein
MAATTFSGPVTSTNGFVGNVTGNVTGNATGAIAASTLALTNVSGAVTAFAGGGKGSATPLTSVVNRVTTVASAADSVLLPAPTVVGQLLVIDNRGANACQVFGQGTDTIDGVSTGTGISQAAGTTGLYIAMTIGTAAVWSLLLGA